MKQEVVSRDAVSIEIAGAGSSPIRNKE